jgi:hypothetical protein
MWAYTWRVAVALQGTSLHGELYEGRIDPVKPASSITHKFRMLKYWELPAVHLLIGFSKPFKSCVPWDHGLPCYFLHRAEKELDM